RSAAQTVAIEDAAAARIEGDAVVPAAPLGKDHDHPAATVAEADVVIAARPQFAPHFAVGHAVPPTVAESELESGTAEAEVEVDVLGLHRHAGEGRTAERKRNGRGAEGLGEMK